MQEAAGAPDTGSDGPRRGTLLSSPPGAQTLFRAGPQKPDPVVLWSPHAFKEPKKSTAQQFLRRPDAARSAQVLGLSPAWCPDARGCGSPGVCGWAPEAAPAAGLPLGSLCLLLRPSPPPIRLRCSFPFSCPGGETLPAVAGFSESCWGSTEFQPGVLQHLSPPWVP